MPQPRSAVRNGAVIGANGGGQAAAAPNPSQPQLKSVPMIAKMEEAKRRLRQPAPPGGPAPRGMRAMPGGGGTSPGSPGTMDAPMSVDASMLKPRFGPGGPPPPGAEPGGAVNFGPPMGPPGGDDPYAMLPPRMRESARAAGRDPREAVASRMANDPNYRQQMIQQFTSGGFGGPPAGIPGPSISAPDMPDSGPAGMGLGGPGDLPPGAEPGGAMPPGNEAPGSRRDHLARLPVEELQQRLGNLRQQVLGGSKDAAALDGSKEAAASQFNPGSLADLYGQIAQGKRPPQAAGAPAGMARSYLG